VDGGSQDPLSRGLSESEAAARLKAEGPNTLPQADRRTFIRIILEILREPMFALLLGAAVIYLVLGDLKEAVVLGIFACTSVLIAVVQESRTERVLESLRDLTSPRALVIRDGIEKRIAGAEVVRGDLVILAEGDRVPADATVLATHDLHCDESLLTGEAVPVRKIVSPGAPLARPGGDDLPYMYSGSMVVRGHGRAEVTATGAHSEIGKIGLAITRIDTEPPRLRVQTRRLVRNFAAVSVSLSALAVVLYGLWRGGWLDALLSGIALGMSMLPEEFPLVLTVFMVMGAWRISRARVLTRRVAAIETLGAATVLCTDKTGTLTQNRMTIVALRAGNNSWRQGDRGPVDGKLATLLEYGILASARQPFDPMEKAFHALGAERPLAEHSSDSGGTLKWEYGLQPDLLAVTHVYEQAGSPGLIVAAKGAPEAIAALCQLPERDRGELRRAVDEMAQGGTRVLAVARASLEGMSDGDLKERVRSATIFARTMPEQKLRIVNALKADGEVVAMTGDGVNDAPSLKAAHIGIAMGGRGTDVAREAASLILLDDDFTSIVAAVRLGRRIYDNLRKAMAYILAVHVPIAGLALIPLLFGLPLLFWPLHIAFLEMVIDPVCSIVFEAEGEEADTMDRPPRHPSAPLFTASFVIWSLLQGVLVLALVAGLFVMALHQNLPEPDARALSFAALVAANLGLVLVNRSLGASILAAFARPNAALWWVVTATAAILTGIILFPPARDLFHFGPLHGDDILVALASGFIALLLLEFAKKRIQPLLTARLRQAPAATR